MRQNEQEAGVWRALAGSLPVGVWSRLLFPSPPLEPQDGRKHGFLLPELWITNTVYALLVPWNQGGRKRTQVCGPGPHLQVALLALSSKGHRCVCPRVTPLGACRVALGFWTFAVLALGTSKPGEKQKRKPESLRRHCHGVICHDLAWALGWPLGLTLSLGFLICKMKITS